MFQLLTSSPNRRSGYRCSVLIDILIIDVKAIDVLSPSTFQLSMLRLSTFWTYRRPFIDVKAINFFDLSTSMIDVLSIKVLSIKVLSINILSIDFLCIDILSINVLSINILSIDVLSIDVMSQRRVTTVSNTVSDSICKCLSWKKQLQWNMILHFGRFESG